MPPKTQIKENEDNMDNNETLSIAELLEDQQGELESQQTPEVIKKKVQQYYYLKYLRIVLFLIIWLIFSILLMIRSDYTSKWIGTAIPTGKIGKEFPITRQPRTKYLTLILKGPFQYQLVDVITGAFYDDDITKIHEKDEKAEHKLFVDVKRKLRNGFDQAEVVAKRLTLALIDPETFNDQHVAQIIRSHTFEIVPVMPINANENMQRFDDDDDEHNDEVRKNENDKDSKWIYVYQFSLNENVERPLPLQLESFPIATRTPESMILSILVLTAMYMVFFWDVTARVIGAMFFCTMAIGLQGIYENRPSINDLLKLTDLDNILLVIGLTIIIRILTETGLKSYIAVQAYRLSNGHIWPMLTVMCAVIAFGAAFLDNMTIMMLTTSIAIRLCEILEFNATAVLTCLMIFSNIGYMLTKTGIPEQTALSIEGIKDSKYNYGNYVLQMIIPVLLTMCITYGYLRFFFATSQKMRVFEAPVVARLRRAIRLWQTTAQGFPSYTNQEKGVQDKLFSKVKSLRQRLKRLGKMPVPPKTFNETVQRLRLQYPIKDRRLAIICGMVFATIVLGGIANTFGAHFLSTGWISILLALVLLGITDWHDFDGLMTKIDWSSLIMITCLSIISSALIPFGLFESIGTSIMKCVSEVSTDYRPFVAVILLLCSTTLCSSIMNSTSVCLIMSSKAIYLSRAVHLELSLEPMLIAVILGTGFGCNTTLVSSFSNTICAGIAEKNGYRFYFWDFCKIGVVVTLLNVVMGIIYLVILTSIYL